MPYARNARLHTDEQVDQIAASMREWGFTVPVLIDKKNEIIAGHGRVMAAAKLGLDTVPVMVATGWTKKQIKTYRIADNQLALNSAWDVKLLAAEMSDLVEAASLIGFTEGQLQNIFLDRADGETDASAEWTGMPGFDHGDKKALRSIVFHFPTQKDVDDFITLTGLKITDKTRFVWFPHTTIDRYMDKRYVNDAAA